MDRDTFLRLQFEALRTEIADTKARTFRTLGFGLAVVPGAHFLAAVYNVDALMISVPVLTIVVALLYLSENHALMRCGTYILEHIEPHVPEVCGWEEWLAAPRGIRRRTVDVYLSYAFYLVFLVYYAGSVFLAVRFALHEYGIACALTILSAYAATGVAFTAFLVRNVRSSTKTPINDSRGPGAQRGASHEPPAA